MAFAIKMSDEEREEYEKKIKSKKYLTLNDIIYTCNRFNLTDKDKPNNPKRDFESFSKKFKKIQEVFALEGLIFERVGENKEYCLSLEGGKFIRELYIRMRKRSIWNDIISIKQTEENAFYDAYKKSKDKKSFFNEITFFINGVINVIRKEHGEDCDGVETHKMRRHLYNITQYLTIESHRPIYKLQSQIDESIEKLHDLIDKIQTLPPRYISKLSDKAYINYAHSISILEGEVNNEVSKFKMKTTENILKMFIEKKNSKIFLKNYAVAQKIVDNLKDISSALYSNLTVENMGECLNEITTNISEYKSIYIEEQNAKYPEREEEYIILYSEILGHLYDAILQLDNGDFQLLEEGCLKESHRISKL